MTVTDHHGNGKAPAAPRPQWALASQLVEEENDPSHDPLRFLAASAMQREVPTALSNNESLSLRDREIIMDKPFLGTLCTLSEQGNLDMPVIAVESSKVASDPDSYNTHDETTAQAVVGNEYAPDLYHFTYPIGPVASETMVMHKYREFIVQTFAYQDSLRQADDHSVDLGGRPVPNSMPQTNTVLIPGEEEVSGNAVCTSQSSDDRAIEHAPTRPSNGHITKHDGHPKQSFEKGLVSHHDALHNCGCNAIAPRQKRD